MEIIPLSEGSFSIDASKVFIPFNTVKEPIQNRPLGSILVEIQPFLVVTKKDIILIDTGLGYALPDGTPQLYYNIEKAGYKPSQITKVLMSHLHKDHAGGLSIQSEIIGEQLMAFPYATHYVQRREFNYAMGMGSASYINNDFAILADFSKVVWLEEDQGIIDGYIHYQLTGAHSKFHQVFWLVENDITCFFGGDDAPQLQQMKNKFVAKYDFDGKKCMELRRKWWEEGSHKKWAFLFYHDIAHPIYKNCNG